MSLTHIPDSVLAAANDHQEREERVQQAKAAFPYVAVKNGEVDWEVTQSLEFKEACSRGAQTFSTKKATYRITAFDDAFKSKDAPVCDPWERCLATDSKMGKALLAVGKKRLRLVALAIVLDPDVFGALSITGRMTLLASMKRAKDPINDIDLFAFITEEMENPTPSCTTWPTWPRPTPRSPGSRSRRFAQPTEPRPSRTLS